MKNQTALDIQNLRDACFYYAKEIINSKQVLIPFGCSINCKEEMLFKENQLCKNEENNLIEIISLELNKLMYIKKINAWAICYDAQIRKSESMNQDIICIEISHQNEKKINSFYFPYDWKNKELQFKPVLSKKE